MAGGQRALSETYILSAQDAVQTAENAAMLPAVAYNQAMMAGR